MIKYVYYFIAIMFFLTLIVFRIRFYMLSNDNRLFKLRVTRTTGKKNPSGIIYGYKEFKTAYSPTDESQHVAVFGGTGSGKSSAIVIPTLKAWSRSDKDTFFCIDIVERDADAAANKYSLADNVECKNKLIYEPLRNDSMPYNVFYCIDNAKSESEKYQLLENLALILLPNTTATDGASMYYNKGGRKILTAALIEYYFQGMDFCDICTHIVNYDVNSLLFEIDSGNNQKARSFISEFRGVKDSDKSGCFEQCKGSVQLFYNDSCDGHENSNVLCKTFRRPLAVEKCLTPDKIENHNVFVVIPDNKLQIYKTALRIIASQCLDYFSSRTTSANSNILFLLDEYSSLGAIDLKDALAKYRKRKVRIMILTQSLPDLDLIYGETLRKVLVSNFGVKIVLNCSEPETSKYFADLIGKEKKKKYSVSQSENSKSETEHEDYEYIVPPEYFSMLKDSLILIRDGYGWTELRKAYHYRKMNRFKAIVDILKLALRKKLQFSTL